MSGKDGSRGYLYQAMHAAIDSLNNPEWLFVQIEPDTQKEKVDIIWYFENDEIKVTQVKSSKNQFSKPQIIQWLKQVAEDVPSAKEIELALIGTCTDTTKKFINKTDSNKLTEKEKSEFNIDKEVFCKLRINIRDYKIETLESEVTLALLKFFSSKGQNINVLSAENMAHSIIYQFFKFSTKGIKISKINFEKRLMDWAEFNFPDVFEATNNTDLDIEFYLANEVEFSNTFTRRIVSFFEIESISKKKMELKEEVNEIKRIKVFPVNPEIEKLFENTAFSMMMTNPLEKVTEIKYSSSDKKDMRTLTENLLQIELEEHFFEVGNVKKHTMLNQISLDGRKKSSYSGDDDAVSKFQRIEKLRRQLSLLNSYILQNEFLNKFVQVPLVLKNQGKKFDQGIRVLIKLPKAINVLRSENYLKPSYNILEAFLGEEEGLLYQKLRHTQDSKVQSVSVDWVTKYFNAYDAFVSHEDRQKDLYNEFENDLESIFDFKFYQENEFNILEFRFDRLSPKEVLAFPCYIFVEANNDFSVFFDITSEQSSDVISGELKYKFSK